MTTRTVRRLVPAVGATLALLLAAGCGGGSDDESGTSGGPTTVTLWVASPTEAFSQRLVDEYNATHDDVQVELTAIPDDGFLQKVGTAAGARSLPDILVSDVVYMPNYASQGILLDISDRIEALPFADDLAPSHLEASTWDGKTYGVPHKLASSVFFYNKDLFTQAGLDPEAPPTDFEQVLAAARAIGALGPDVHGFDFGGNCGGCSVYTMLPYLWAAGVDPLADQGTTADFDNDATREVFSLYKTLWDEGLTPPNANTQDGSTWADGFLSGTVGMMAQGSAMVGRLQTEATFDWGVTRIMAPDGSGTSTFVGGDSAGITATSEHPDEAWDFIQWSLEDEAQTEIIAQNGDLPDRTDLSGNEYTAADPRLQFIVDGVADGRTPLAVPFGELFNDPSGPWIAMVRGAVFGDDADAAIAEGQAAIQQGLDDAAEG